MARLRLGLLLSLGSLCVGCPGAPKEGPPPAESYAIASAAPGALGALAAGTRAAPRALTKPPGPGGVQSEEETVPDEDDEDGGVGPAPDGGAAGPEDVPL